MNDKSEGEKLARQVNQLLRGVIIGFVLCAVAFIIVSVLYILEIIP